MNSSSKVLYWTPVTWAEKTREEESLNTYVTCLQHRRSASQTLFCWRGPLPSLKPVVTWEGTIYAELEWPQNETGLVRFGWPWQMAKLNMHCTGLATHPAISTLTALLVNVNTVTARWRINFLLQSGARGSCLGVGVGEGEGVEETGQRRNEGLGRTDIPSVFCFHRVVLNFSALLLAVY